MAAFGIRSVESSLSGSRSSAVRRHAAAEEVCAGDVVMTGIRCAEALCCGTGVSFGEKLTVLFDLLMMMGKEGCALALSLQPWQIYGCRDARDFGS